MKNFITKSDRVSPDSWFQKLKYLHLIALEENYGEMV